MERQILKKLQQWKRDKARKPLILKGARQVGKTYILTQFGTQEYSNTAYLNFENSPPLHELFSGSLKPKDILRAGLLGAMAGLSAKAIIHGNEIFQEFRGALMENYVAQTLVLQEHPLFYWTSSSQAELDSVLQYDNEIYPVEVKSGISAKKKSLLSYNEKYQPKFSIRTSPMNLKLEKNILNCPSYLVANLNKLLILLQKYSK